MVDCYNPVTSRSYSDEVRPCVAGRVCTKKRSTPPNFLTTVLNCVMHSKACAKVRPFGQVRKAVNFYDMSSGKR